jgi:hypothetical protein
VPEGLRCARCSPAPRAHQPPPLPDPPRRTLPPIPPPRKAGGGGRGFFLLLVIAGIGVYRCNYRSNSFKPPTTPFQFNTKPPGLPKSSSIGDMFFKQGKQAEDGRDFQQAVKSYRLAADEGHWGAMNRLGAMHESGEGVLVNLPLAASWYQKAADAGDTTAMYNLGRLNETRMKNTSAALTWYSKAAAKGNREAQRAMERLGPER